ncbi:MAG: dihydroneopterin aldolase [Parabacteroides sp.]|nr:dihydroneopterin aldolase [Parabacteroides sp.]
MKTWIELEAMRFYAYHGVMPQERKVGNYYLVNLRLSAPLEKAVVSDDLKDTINYATVYEVVKEEMEIPSQLLEHVAGRILSVLKERFPQLEEVHLKVSKLNPPFGGDIYSASVILNERFC